MINLKHFLKNKPTKDNTSKAMAMITGKDLPLQRHIGSINVTNKGHWETRLNSVRVPFTPTPEAKKQLGTSLRLTGIDTYPWDAESTVWFKPVLKQIKTDMTSKDFTESQIPQKVKNLLKLKPEEIRAQLRKKPRKVEDYKAKWDNYPNTFLTKDETSKQYFTPSNDSELTAAQKFGGRNIKRLKKLGSGRDRDVYALEPGKVLKIAKNPLGLVQNMSERDLQYLDQLKAYEEGKDYVVMQRAQKPGRATTALLRPLKKFTQIDFDEHKDELQQALRDADLDDIRNFDTAYGDIKAKRNWGEINGRPVLVDGGALNIHSIDKKKTPEWATKEWREVQTSRSAFKNKGAEDKDPDMKPGRYSSYEERLRDFPIPDKDETSNDYFDLNKYLKKPLHKRLKGIEKDEEYY